MIGKTKPPPGFCVVDFSADGEPENWVAFLYDHDNALTTVELTQEEAVEASHRLYAELSRPAVIEFAEQVATWGACPDGQVSAFEIEFQLAVAFGLVENTRQASNRYAAEQILAAARGERTLP